MFLSSLYGGYDFGESFWITQRDVSEALSVELDAFGVQLGDELAVAKSMLADGSVDA